MRKLRQRKYRPCEPVEQPVSDTVSVIKRAHALNDKGLLGVNFLAQAGENYRFDLPQHGDYEGLKDQKYQSEASKKFRELTDLSKLLKQK